MRIGAFLLVSFALYGCGANVVFEDGAQAAGGSGGGSVASCLDVQGCCAAACGFAATLPCFEGECECGLGNGDGCRAAWVAFIQCAIPQAEDVFVCDAGDAVLNCSICGDEQQNVRDACDRPLGCRDL